MLDFIQYINDNVQNLTSEEKTGLLTDFVSQYHYQDLDGDGNPNPVSKRDFANEKITMYIKASIDAIRKSRAQQSASYTEIILE